jgi:hypothetical protein
MGDDINIIFKEIDFEDVDLVYLSEIRNQWKVAIEYCSDHSGSEKGEKNCF